MESVSPLVKRQTWPLGWWPIGIIMGSRWMDAFFSHANLIVQTLFYDGFALLLLFAGLTHWRCRKRGQGIAFFCLSAACFVWVFVNILVIYPATH